jgi:hypothetical protein
MRTQITIKLEPADSGALHCVVEGAAAHAWTVEDGPALGLWSGDGAALVYADPFGRRQAVLGRVPLTVKGASSPIQMTLPFIEAGAV